MEKNCIINFLKMSKHITKIKEVEIPILGTASQLSIMVGSFPLFPKSIQIYFELQDEDGKVLLTGNETLDESEIEKWGDDDNYVKDLIISKLNLEEDADYNA